MTMKQNKNFYFNQNYKPIKRHYPYYNELNTYKNFFKKIPKLSAEDKDIIKYFDKQDTDISENKGELINYHIISDKDSDLELNFNYSEINLLADNNTILALNYEDCLTENNNNPKKIIKTIRMKINVTVTKIILKIIMIIIKKVIQI